MPSNKEALVRYRAINRCLINNKVATQNALVEACTEAIGAEVSWRSIAGDISAMRNDEQLGYLAPIKNIKGQGYTYTDPKYSIDSIPLLKEELTAIAFAANVLKQYSHVDLFSTFSEAVEKLSDKVELHIKENDTTALGNVISFEQSNADGGNQYINDLLQHIRQHTTVIIEYHSFSSNSVKSHTLHPYFLKEYRNRWYVVGFHEGYKQIRTLALERMKSIVPDYDASYKPSEFDIQSYYKDAMGVSITQEKPQKIVLELSPKEYQYIESQPLHNSQKLISQNKDEVRIELFAILNYELKSTLLSMGSNVIVKEPASLKTFMLNEAIEMMKLHK
ncbi:MAG: putative DNA-binding transcriptional regulator YafY [Bacteroidia bacterium]|jgi:predicted DNA-binding transcriptional regulator YafY